MTAPSSLINFKEYPLVPAVIQDDSTDAVLMVGFMNELAFDRTRSTGFTHFWSRSRQKLWKKGETSGHVQEVRSIAINCETNSVLIRVEQVGAVCHEGYPTCFYREIADDGSVQLTHDRVFDPSAIYGYIESSAIELTRLWYGAYEYLRDHDMTRTSKTSLLLRERGELPGVRIAEELDELAGALTGQHRHEDLEGDLILEGSQCLYWLAVTAVKSGHSWDAVRPDRAMSTNANDLSSKTAAALIESSAAEWRLAAVASPERIHATIALVSQAVAAKKLNPMKLIEKDLAGLRSRPYLRDYFGLTPED